MRPIVRNIRKRRQSISVFRGINRSVNTAMSKLSSNSSSIFMEFKNTKNVTLDDYPAIRTRDKRLYIYEEGLLSNILATDKGIIRISNKDGGVYLYIGEEKIDFTTIYLPDREHQLIEYGNFVVVLPEKVVVNLVDKSVRKMENSFTSESAVALAEAEFNLQMTVLNTSIEPSGKVYYEFLHTFSSDITDSELQKSTTAHGDWFDKFEIGDIIEDKSTVPSTIYLVTDIKEDTEVYAQYHNSKLVFFTRIDDTYTKITREGIGEGFKVGDFVRVSFSKEGFTLGVEEGILSSSFELYEVGEDYIIINYSLQQSQNFTGAIEVHRQLPCDMDFMVACNNRLWGCSSKSNAIYTCRLGDPTNWEAYGSGIASDSYFAELGTEGEFTGITASGQSVYFFKENCIHRFYGTKPTNFTLSTYLDQGVKKGSENSIVWLKDRLFYNSPSGVCVYSPGGEPQIISEEAFGDTIYTESVGGKHGGKYVISLKREDGEWELFVYDTECGQWLLEGNEHISCTSSYRDVLYFRLGDTNYLGCMSNPPDCLLRRETSKELLEEGELEWCLESGYLYDAYSEQKYIQKVELILETEKGEVSLWISKDGKPYERVKMQYATRKQSITIPLYPGRCHNFRIKLEGRGKVYLYSVTLTTEEGSSSNGKL